MQALVGLGWRRMMATFALVCISLLGNLGLARPVAAAPVLSFTVDAITCNGVIGIFTWSDAPIGTQVRAILHNDIIIDGEVVAFDVVDAGDQNGSAQVFIPFFSEDVAGWLIKVNVWDGSSPQFEVKYPLFDKPCAGGNGFVSPGPTGDGEGSPTDARSGAAMEDDNAGPTEDPDGDGRVQVP